MNGIEWMYTNWYSSTIVSMHINDQASTLASLIAVLWFSLLKKCHHTFQSVRLQQKIYKPESNSRKERIDQSYIINLECKQEL